MSHTNTRLSTRTHLVARAILSAGTIAAAAAPASAQCTPAVVAHLGGDPAAIALRANLGYVGYAGEIRISNLTNPAAPTSVGRVLIPGTPQKMILAGSYLYAACGDSGLVIVDVSTPASPVLVATVPNERTEDVAVSGGLAYVVADFDLKIYDIANPAAPILRSTHAAGFGHFVGVVSAGTTAYTLTQVNEVEVVDASTPTAPAVLDVYAGTGSIGETIALRGTTLAILNWDNVELIDVSNPAALAQFSTVAVDTIPDHMIMTQSGGTTLLHYEYDIDEIKTYDVTNPAAPTFRSRLEVRPGILTGLGTMVYIEQSGDILAYDYTSPATPALVHTAEPNPDVSRAIAVVGQYALIPTETELLVYNIATPASPTLSLTQPLAGYATDLAAVGRTVYVMESGVPGRIEVFDFTNPLVPVLLGTGTTTEYPEHIAVEDGVAAVTATFGSLQLYDVSDPAAITPLGSVASLGGDTLYINDGAVFVSKYSEGVTVVDISDPAAPVVVGVNPPRPLQYVDGFAMRGRTAFVGQSDNRVDIMDMSDAANPVFMASFTAPRGIDSLGVLDSLLLVNSGEDEISFVDTADPAHPTFISSMPGIGYTTSYALRANTGWADGSTAGVYAFTLPGFPRIERFPEDAVTCPATPSVDFTVTLRNPAGATYQWKRNGANVTDGPGAGGATFSGATTNRLTITDAGPFQVADYSCTVTNGCGTTTTSSGHLSAAVGLVITQHPADQVVCEEDVLTFEIAGVGTLPATYQWQVESPAGSGIYIELEDRSYGRFTVAGARQRILTITPDTPDTLPPAIETAFRCVASNTCGSVTSNPGHVTLAPCGCNPDYNQDGGADLSDTLDLAADISAGTESFPPNSSDFNQDGAPDVSDILDLANVVAGGACP